MYYSSTTSRHLVGNEDGERAKWQRNDDDSDDDNDLGGGVGTICA